MGRDGHGLPKVSPGPAMPNPSTPCGWTTPKAVSGVDRLQGERPAAVLYPNGDPTPHAARLWLGRPMFSYANEVEPFTKFATEIQPVIHEATVE
jgi:hypothetical protein